MPEMRILNPVPRLILRSPLHAVLSRRLALLSFRGRKTGRWYHLPLSYVSRDGEVIMTTDSGWWRNLRGGRPVRIRLGGRTRSGTARVVTEPAEVRAALEELVAAQPSYARFAEIRTLPGGALDLDRAARERVLIRIELEAAA